MDLELIRQRNQTKINKDNIHKNRHRVDYDYKIRDDIMLTHHTIYKYETSYKGSFMITPCFTNVMVKLQCSVTQIKYNICCIEPYISDTKVEDSG